MGVLALMKMAMLNVPVQMITPAIRALMVYSFYIVLLMLFLPNDIILTYIFFDGHLHSCRK